MEQEYIDPRDALKAIEAQDFLNLGVQQVAYIKGLKDGHKTSYAVCAADGKIMNVLPSQQAAITAIMQSDLDVVTLH